jgi:hypothetical protein
MQRFWMRVTFSRCEALPAKVRHSVPATRPSPPVTVPSASTFGPNRVP